MKYTREERLDIGKRIYEGEIDRYRATEEYGISERTARDYVRQYRIKNDLPVKGRGVRNDMERVQPKPVILDPDLEEYESMTQKELIRELVRSKIREARLKKGYEVKGVGAEKVFILLNSKNTR